MATLQTKQPFISTFLSHSSADSELVEAVAKRLGRRGVLAWLDKNELIEMGSLNVALKQAVQQQATLTIFLSEASLKSEWCRDELKWAIEAQVGTDHLLPVYLGDPLQLVRSHDLLRTRFLHRDGDRVNQLGFACQQNEPNPDAIAEMIAATAYRRSIPDTWSEVAIVIDQRGSGQRRGLPILPANVADSDIPTLTFRPDLGMRQMRELLTGSDWEDMAQTMSIALSTALKTIRGDTRKIRVLGNSQTGLMWLVGQHFDRTTSADLYGYGRDDIPLTNKGQVRHTSLSGGDPNAAKQINGPTLSPELYQTEVALGIGTSAKFASAVKQTVPDLPLFWLESGLISDSQQVMSLITDMVASVERLRQDYGVQQLVLFWTTANNVALLAAANLTSHVIPQIKYMEWDHDRSEYVSLSMPGDLSRTSR